MIYRRKRRKTVDVETPKEYPALRATENLPPGELEGRTARKGKTKLGAVSSKLRAWSKPRSLPSGANDAGSTSSGSNCPSRGQISATQDQSALAIVQSKFGQLRRGSDQSVQTAEAVRLQAIPGFVGSSLMIDPAEPTHQQQQSHPVESPAWRADVATPPPEAVIRPSLAEISIPPEAHTMRQDRLSLYFGHPFPSHAAPSASPNPASPKLPAGNANASYIDDDTSTSIDTTLSDDEGRDEGPQRIPTPVKVGFPPEASSAERVGSATMLTQRASAASMPAISPRLGYPQGGLLIQPQLSGQESAVNSDSETVAKRPTIPNWDYHFF
jgi:hypothetical protein